MCTPFMEQVKLTYGIECVEMVKNEMVPDADDIVIRTLKLKTFCRTESNIIEEFKFLNKNFLISWVKKHIFHALVHIIKI